VSLHVLIIDVLTCFFVLNVCLCKRYIDPLIVCIEMSMNTRWSYGDRKMSWLSWMPSDNDCSRCSSIFSSCRNQSLPQPVQQPRRYPFYPGVTVCRGIWHLSGNWNWKELTEDWEVCGKTFFFLLQYNIILLRNLSGCNLNTIENNYIAGSQ